MIKDAALAERLGVSITPVREAVVQLTAEGLVDALPNRSKRIASLSRQNALQLLEVARILVRAGFEWGLPHLSEEDRECLRDAHGAFQEAAERGLKSAAAAASIQFKMIVIEASGNDELASLVSKQLVRLRVLLLKYSTSDELELDVVSKCYKDVLRFIESGDLDAASECIAELFRDVSEILSSSKYE